MLKNPFLNIYIIIVLCLLGLDLKSQRRVQLDSLWSHIGDSVVVFGRICGVNIVSDSIQEKYYLYVGKNVPGENLDIIINSTSNFFPKSELSNLNGKYIKVIGRVELIGGLPTIILDNLDQVEILKQSFYPDEQDDVYWFVKSPGIFGVIIGSMLALIITQLNEWIKRRMIRAKLSFVFKYDGFEKNSQFIWYTPEIDPEGIKPEYINCYVQVGVQNLSNKTARGCRATLTRMEREEEAGYVTLFSQSLPLIWSYIDAIPMDIVGDSILFISLTSVEPNDKHLKPQTFRSPLLYSEILKKTGLYKFSIKVVGDNFNMIETSIFIRVVIKPDERNFLKFVVESAWMEDKI